MWCGRACGLNFSSQESLNHPNKRQKITILITLKIRQNQPTHHRRITEFLIRSKDDCADKREDNGQGSTEVFGYSCRGKIGHYDANNEWGLFPDSASTDF
jgi:hypothetical protein